MKRKIKNIIMIILIVLLCTAMFFTINYQNNNFKSLKNNSDLERPSMPSTSTGNGFENIDQMMSSHPERNSNQDEMSEPPAKPEGEENKIIPQNGEQMERPNQNIPKNEPNNTLLITILLATEGLALSLTLTYLILSKFNKLSFKETFAGIGKIIIYILVVGILTTGITFFALYLRNKNEPTIRNNQFMPEESTTVKETTAENVEAGENISEKNINLSNYSSNVTITESGSYTLTGEFKYSVLINSTGAVTLNLDNVTITNDTTAAIANISTNELVINLPSSTVNTLTDGGSSEYDACIYSAGPLTITGDGKLDVYGKQEEGEGIATETNNVTINGGIINIESNDDGINAGGDGGTIAINDGTIYIKASGDGIDSNKDIIINGGSVYSMGSSVGGDAGIDADQGITINGGEVLALGSDMLEKPLETSKQFSLSFNLDSKIENGSVITLKNENNEEISNFTADEDFKTLIISNEKLKAGTYSLYKDGEKIAENTIK